MKSRRLSDLADFLDSLPRLTAEEADAFASDIEAARADENRLPIRDPWVDDESADPSPPPAS